jgi:regulator of PEP synthase PpsR (kinase-PPPase family)
MNPEQKIIYLVGERTGQTISKVAAAVLSQFATDKIQVRLFTMVEDTSLLLSILSRAQQEKALVVYTIVAPQNREFLEREAAKRELETVDVMGNFIVKLALFLEQRPLGIPGKQHQIDANYYRRIDAIEFAVKHDDGRSPHTLHRADIVLIGLSRTGKTPISAYMAQMGWRVANIPLVPDIPPPDETFAIDQVKIYGLAIESDALVRVRQERLKYLGLPDDARYADRNKIFQEVEWCHAFYRKHPHWPVIDVSGRAIEEVAARIMQLHSARLQARQDRDVHRQAQKEGPRG